MSNLVLAPRAATQVKRLRELDERLTTISRNAQLFNPSMARHFDARSVLDICRTLLQNMPQIQRELDRLATANRTITRTAGQSIPAQTTEISGLTSNIRRKVPGHAAKAPCT